MTQLPNMTAPAPRYHFLDMPFYNGMVFTHIAGSGNYDLIVGLDFGHGETLVYLYERSGTEWKLRRLKMNYEDDHKLPTYISYTADGIVFGHEAAKDLQFIQHFKTSPTEWDKKPDSVHSCRDLMHDYLSRLWENICRYNTELRPAQAAGRLLVVVGCPAATQWISHQSRKAYQELVTEATGCAHSFIMPESNAAIMAAIHGATLNLSRGVAIYDIGSSTLDFTYVLMGKVLISRSLDIGGMKLDRAMLRKILADNQMTEQDIPDGQLADVLAQVRKLKERYFPAQTPLPPSTIPLLAVNEDGEAIPGCYSGRELKVQIDEAFMTAVLTADTEMDMKQADYEDLSWLQCVEKFFRYSEGRIGNRPCGTVILTGGTSLIPAVQEAARSIYGVAAVRPVEDPSVSVAMGLCLARGLELNAAAELAPLRKELEEDLFERMFLFLRRRYADHLIRVFWEITHDVLAGYVQDGRAHKTRELLQDVTRQALQDDRIVGTQAEAALQKVFQSAGEETQKGVCEKINELSRKIYRAQISEGLQLPPVQAALSPDLLLQLNVKTLIQGMALDATIFEQIYAAIALLLMGGGALSLNPLLMAAGALMEADPVERTAKKLFRRFNYRMSPKMCRELADQFEPWRLDLVDTEELKTKLVALLGTQESLREAYDQMTSGQLELALGQVLFLIFTEPMDCL